MTRTLITSAIIMFISFHTITAQEYTKIHISKEELIEAGGINIYFDNFDFDTEVKVISYVASVTWAGFLKEVKVTGTNKFTKQVIELIENSKRKGKIYFENIKVQLEDGTIRTLQPIVVRIK